MTNKTTNKFSPEIRERSVCMVLDHEADYPSRWTAILFVAQKIGCAPGTLNDWIKKTEVDSGKRAGVPTDLAEKMKALERENRELRQANEILRKASAYNSNEFSMRSRSGHLEVVATRVVTLKVCQRFPHPTVPVTTPPPLTETALPFLRTA